jgi:uncharacterized protein (DUF4213/DUF364 family)
MKHAGPVTSPSTQGASALILEEATSCLAGLYGEGLHGVLLERLVIGVFFTGVKLSTGCGGVAYTPPETIRRASTRILKGSLPKYSGMRIPELLGSDLPGPFGSVIRLAILNALSVPYLENGRYTVSPGDDLSACSKLFAGKRICMVGAIIPLLKRLHELGAAEIAVVDQKEETRLEASLGKVVPVSEIEASLARCQTAVFTGASIANGTIETLLGYVPADAAIAVVGPTAGFVPEPLFRRKVALVGTVLVTDPEQALGILAEGGGAYQLFGRCVRKINLINRTRMLELDQVG